MADKISYSLTGTKDIVEALDSLKPKVLNNIIKSTNRKALNQEIKKKVQAALPYSAKTKKGIKTLGDKEDRATGVWAGATSDVFYLRFLEKGTKVRTTESGANRGRITPNPRIVPTIESNVDNVVNFFNKDAGEEIAKIMQRKLKRIK